MQRVGELVVAIDGPHHLERLREQLELMRCTRTAALSARPGPWYSTVSTEAVEYAIELRAARMRRLTLIGSNAWHGVDLGARTRATTDLVPVIDGS